MQRLRGSFTIRSRKRASARRVRSSSSSRPSSRPLATDSPFTGTIAVVCKLVRSPTPRKSGYRRRREFMPRRMRLLFGGAAKCRGELEGSLRQSAPALAAPPSGSGSAAPAVLCGRRIGVLGVADHAVDQALVERGDPRGGRWPPDRPHEEIGRALHHLPGDVGAHRHHGRREQPRSPPGAPASQRSGRSRSPGWTARSTIASAVGDRLESTSGVGSGVGDAFDLDPLDRRLGVLGDQVLLKVAPALGGLDPRPDRLLAHRQHRGAHAQGPRDLRLGVRAAAALGDELTRRYRQVARSRSERRNQSGAPSLTRRSKTVKESSLMPQPRCSSISPLSQ